MKSRKRLAPRKEPRQQRAKATVDAILQATAYILVKEGWDKLTTNRVAERAGVNIASLYQYFPSKEAIVTELQRRHIDEARTTAPNAIVEFRNRKRAGVSTDTLLRNLIESAVLAHRTAPALHRVFNEEIPRSVQRLSSRAEEKDAQWRDLVAPLLSNVPNPELACYISRVTLDAVIHETVSQRPELLDDPEFIAETVELLKRYFVRKGVRANLDAG